MVFDGTVNLGHVLNALMFVIGGLYFVWEVKNKLQLLIQETTMRHEANVEKFNTIELQIKELINTTVTIAKQEMRMNNLDERIQEISNRLSGHIKNGTKRRSTR